MKKLTMALFIAFFSFGYASAFAETVCGWTVHGTDENFKTDPIFSKKPMMQKSACAEGQAPTCVGYMYCREKGSEPGKVPPNIIPVACKSIPIAGKWSCPDAATCYRDEDVAMEEFKDLPKKAAGAPAQGQGSGTAVRDGAPK